MVLVRKRKEQAREDLKLRYENARRSAQEADRRLEALLSGEDERREAS
jgi:hypothetical protein